MAYRLLVVKTPSFSPISELPMNSAPVAPLPFHLSLRAVRWRRLWLGIMLLGLSLSYVVTRTLPVSVGWENGWLEDIQVVVLLTGALTAFCFAYAGNSGSAVEREAKGLAMALVPVWFLLAARELSWGAVLLPSVGFSEDGPIYSSALLWYKPAVYPAAALVLAGCAWVFARYRADRIVLRLVRSSQFVWAELAVLVLAGALSTYAEGHLGVPVVSALEGRTLVMEEWAEMFAYVALVAAQWHTFALVRSILPPR